jgi:hypothetical protein
LLQLIFIHKIISELFPFTALKCIRIQHQKAVFPAVLYGCKTQLTGRKVAEGVRKNGAQKDISS